MDEKECEADGCENRLGDDFVGIEPVELFAAIEQGLQRTDRETLPGVLIPPGGGGMTGWSSSGPSRAGAVGLAVDLAGLLHRSQVAPAAAVTTPAA
jgi:hypothetical protein